MIFLFDNGKLKVVSQNSTMLIGITVSDSLTLLDWGLRCFSKKEGEKEWIQILLLFPFITLKLLDTFWLCRLRIYNQLLIAFALQTCLLLIAGVPVPSGSTPSSKTTITTSIERTSTSENYKAPPPVAKKPQTEEPRYSTPTKKVITEEFRYQTTPPSQKTVIEEVRYSTTPTKRTVIEEEYR